MRKAMSEEPTYIIERIFMIIVSLQIPMWEVKMHLLPINNRKEITQTLME